MKKLQRSVLLQYFSFLKAIMIVTLPVLLYLTLLTTTWSLALPGGILFSLFILLLLCTLCRVLLEHVGIPGMLGMLLVGVGISNIPLIKEYTVLETFSISSDIKTICLIVILMRGGLSLKLADIKSCGRAVVMLIFLPCFTEAVVYAILSVFLLGLRWTEGFMLGFVVAAVTPAIIVPTLIKLTAQGYEVESNHISTMLISASSFDDVVAISAFMAFLSASVSGGSIVWQVLKGPLEIVLGITIGCIIGITMWVLPPPVKYTESESTPIVLYPKTRLCFILMVAVIVVFGMSYLGFSGAGPLAVIVMSVLVRQGNHPQDTYASDILDTAWAWVAEPLLFGLVGMDIKLGIIGADLLWKACVVITIGLLFRCMGALVAVLGTPLTYRERIFVCIAWIPKATVQAAIGSYALTTVVQLGIQDANLIRASEVILTIAVLVILISAPVGSLLMMFTAKALLSPKAGYSSVKDITEVRKETECDPSNTEL